MQEREDVLQLVTETATIEKLDLLTGRVRVTTQTETAEQLVSAALERQDVEIVRVPLDREIDAVPPVRTEDGVTIVPVVEEILVVEKRLVLREEIHIRQTKTTQTVELPVELRKQHAKIEREDVKSNPIEEDL
ncbi:YsnF/AvaK domain-containing protein [Devosia rhizoryzae]|uniref:YsnF/AvaK domain-containing protein n=1 Tax=Devosia rhizoryzae TaxID=2774137 RepID=A0ABX7C844_9HYPH|nr:YsnF/AvaK domain-containing protein [Devosia rhizoryzae]QQR38877.1 YsnF/AvaK domain-containing protein [Devosia rhizoryzae]